MASNRYPSTLYLTGKFDVAARLPAQDKARLAPRTPKNNGKPLEGESSVAP